MARTEAVSQTVPPPQLVQLDKPAVEPDLRDDPVYGVLDGIADNWVQETNSALKALTHAVHIKDPMKREIGPQIRNVIGALRKADTVAVFSEFVRDARNQLSEAGTYNPDKFEASIEKCRPIFTDVIINQKNAGQRQVDLAKLKIKNINRDPENLAKLWFHWRYPQQILQDHPDFARWVKQSILFDIRGYQNSSPHTSLLSQGILYDAEAKQPMILMNGEWTHWKDIKDKIIYDEKRALLVSADDPKKEWLYTWPGGLVQMSKYEKMEPIFEIGQKDLERLAKHGAKFWETNKDPFPAGLAKDAYVQFYTTKRKSDLPGSSLFYNARNSQSSHVGIRIIIDGKVYDPNYDISQEDYEAIMAGMPFSLLTTGWVNRCMRDFDEFGKPFEFRRTTTIPVPKKCAEDVLKGMMEIPRMRFNYTHQNCVRLVEYVLSTILGYPVKFSTNVWGWIALYLPDLKHIPYVGWIMDKVATAVRAVWNFVVSWTPGFIQTGFSWVVTVLTYVPDQVLTVIINLVGVVLGATRSIGDWDDEKDVHEIDNSDKPRNFKCLLNSWKDFFSKLPGEIHHSKFVMDWQMAQKSTFKHFYSGDPQFTIVPGRIPTPR